MFRHCRYGVVDSYKIHIIDLKLGKGVVVDAEQNVQLMIYGLEFWTCSVSYMRSTRWSLPSSSRGSNIFPTWEISAEELLVWGKDVLEPEQQSACRRGEFKAGDHCRFCKARFTCRARAEEYLKLARWNLPSRPLFG